MKLRISDNVRTPTTVHASHARPARRQRRTKPTSDATITQAGTCNQRTAIPNCPGVSARIIANSSAASTATAVAITAKTRFARAARTLHHTTRYIVASVRHAPPPIAQMIVTQFILPEMSASDHLGFCTISRGRLVYTLRRDTKNPFDVTFLLQKAVAVPTRPDSNQLNCFSEVSLTRPYSTP